MKQNTQNRTNITIKIHKRGNKKYIICAIKQKHTKHTTICTRIKNGAKRIWENVINEIFHISCKRVMIYISSNNFRHPVTKTFATLHFTSPNYTSLHLSTLHFFPFKLHPTTLHYTYRHFTSSHLNFTQLHFTTLSFGSTPFKFLTAPFHLTSLHFISLRG